jgi:putative membrane protein
MVHCSTLVSRFSDMVIATKNLPGGRTFHVERASVHPISVSVFGGRTANMIWIANLLVALVAALHVYFLILEMFLWTKPLGLKTFRNSPEKAADSAVLAANQGLYNGFLAAGLVWGLVQSVPAFAFQIKVFFLLCVIAAGIYGAATVSRRILYVQAAPAALA